MYNIIARNNLAKFLFQKITLDNFIIVNYEATGFNKQLLWKEEASTNSIKGQENSSEVLALIRMPYKQP